MRCSARPSDGKRAYLKILTFWISSFAGVLEGALSIYPTLTAAGGLLFKIAGAIYSTFLNFAQPFVGKKAYLIDTTVRQLLRLWQKAVCDRYAL